MSTKYEVTFAEFTARHYIKKFVKQHSELRWKLTANAIRALCANADLSLQGEKLEVIKHSDHMRLCKLDFAIAGTGVSPKSSGCRAIVIINSELASVEVLLVYHKSYIVKNGNETVAWKRLIEDNFPQYRYLVT